MVAKLTHVRCTIPGVARFCPRFSPLEHPKRPNMPISPIYEQILQAPSSPISWIKGSNSTGILRANLVPIFMLVFEHKPDRKQAWSNQPEH